ncbi:MAG: hypothetical protein Q9208_002137 [Pyrenodesmia sp. 3 TL-2023]
MLLLWGLLFMAFTVVGKAHTIQLKQRPATAPLSDNYNNNNNTQASIIQARAPLVAACNAFSNDFRIPLENGAKLTSFAPLHDNAKNLCSDMCNSGKGGYRFEARQDFWTPSGNGPTVHQRIYCSAQDVAKTVIGYDPTFCRNSVLQILHQFEPFVNASSSIFDTQPSAISPRAPAVSPYGSAAICYSDTTKAPSISLAKGATAVVNFNNLLRDAKTLCRDKCKHSRSSVMLAKYKDYKEKYFGEPKAKTRIYCQARYSEQINGRPLDKKKCIEMFDHIFAWCKSWSSMGNGAADGIQAVASEGNTSIEMLLSLSTCVAIGFLTIANALDAIPDLSIVIDSHSENGTQASMLLPRSQIKCNAPSNPLQIQFEKYGTQLEDFKEYPAADAVKVCGTICISDDRVNNPVNVHRKNLKHKENIDKPELDDPSKYHRRLYCEAEKPSSKTRFNYKTCKETIARIDEWLCNKLSSVAPIPPITGEYRNPTFVSNFYPEDAEKLCDTMCDEGKHYQGFRRGDFHAGWKPKRDHKRLFCTADYATPQSKDFKFDKIACKNYTKMLRENCGTFGGELVGDKTWKKGVLYQGPVPIRYNLWAVILSTGNKRSGIALDETTAIAFPRMRGTSPSMLSPRASLLDRPGSSCFNISSPAEDGIFHVGPNGKDQSRVLVTAKYATSQTDSKFDKDQCKAFLDVLIDDCDTFGGRIFGSQTGYLDGQPIETSARIQYDVWAVTLNK